MSIVRDQFKRPGEVATVGMHLPHSASMRPVKGEVFIEVVDAASGEVLHKEHRQNVITLDAGILAAILLRDPSSRAHGFNMLSVGTGATGAILSPDAPDATATRSPSRRTSWTTPAPSMRVRLWVR
jgi:dTDP-4-dehydrorhamnose 3,5-epimerase-like enzyme